MDSWEKKSRKDRKGNKLWIYAMILYQFFINCQLKFLKKEFINPNELITKNRRDIEIAIEFLNEVVNDRKEIKDTKFYHILSKKEFLIDENYRYLNHFIELYEDIKINGMKKPIIVGKFSGKFIKTFYWKNGTVIIENIINDKNIQLIEGTHRVPVAIFLGLEKIPVKYVNPIFTKIPNFTKYFEN